jgi:hypothetical protein
MPLIYPLVIRYLMERCSSIGLLPQSLTKMCCFLLLSFFTTIVVNFLVPFFILKTSPSSISSLSLLSSSHIFFPSNFISFELQTDLLEKKRTYITNQSKQTNVSIGNIQLLLNIIKICFL